MTISAYTLFYNFRLIDFNSPRWHTDEWSNWQNLDATLRTIGALANKGVWSNAIPYTAGDRVVDSTSSTIYLCLITHTSASSGAFSADRTLHPTYWQLITGVPLYRGTWAAGVTFSVGDITVINNAKWYYCVQGHTSSGLFSSDTAYWVTIFDISGLNNTYYGSRASNPTTRPDGTACQAGDVYYSTSLGSLRLYDGAAWVAFNAGGSTASGITNTPAGNISSTNVQSAINELDTEKADAATTTSALANKAPLVHSHVISDVTGLTTSLADKASKSANELWTGVPTMQNGINFWDANFFAGNVASVPTIGWDSNDTESYDRTNNEWQWKIGGTQVLYLNANRMRIPKGTTAARPGTPADGDMRFNTDLNQYEGYANSAWSPIGGGATGAGGDQVFVLNDQTVNTSYTIPTNRNAMSVGPITIASGAIVTVPTGSTWVVL